MLGNGLRLVIVALFAFGLAGGPGRAFAQEGAEGTPVAADPVVNEAGTPDASEDEPEVDDTAATPETIAPAGELPPDPSVGGALVSNVGDAGTDNDYAVVDFSADIPGGGVAFSSISVLSANIDFEDDDSCGGGSPRFVLETAGGNVNVNIGPHPNFVGCTDGDTGNLLTDGVARFDLSQIGGNFYTTYADAATFLANIPILGIAFVVDGGWFFEDDEQTLTLNSASVDVDGINDFATLTILKLDADTKGEPIPGACFTLYYWTEGGIGDLFAPEQCDEDGDGETVFEELPAPNDIVVVETEAPPGYAPGDDEFVELDEGPDVVFFDNHRAYGDLQILKYACEVPGADSVSFAVAEPDEPAAVEPDETCGPIGAAFQIIPFSDDSETPIPATVDATGSLIVVDLPVTNGHPHTLIETGTGASAQFEIGPDDVTIVQVFNNTEPTGTLFVTYFDCLGNTAGIEFQFADPTSVTFQEDAICERAPAAFTIDLADQEVETAEVAAAGVDPDDPIHFTTDATDGSATVAGLPVTTGPLHLLTHDASQESAEFPIAADAVTAVTVINYLAVPPYEPPPGAPPTSVTSLPNTGAGGARTSNAVWPGVILLLVAGFGVAATAIRRRSAA